MNHKKYWQIPANLPIIRRLTSIRTLSVRSTLLYSFAALIILTGIFLFLKYGHSVYAVPWPGELSDWGKRKQLTLVNNTSGNPTLTTGTTYQINLDTQSLGKLNQVMSSCDDVRIFDYPLTAVQVKTLYNENAAVRFGP